MDIFFLFYCFRKFFLLSKYFITVFFLFQTDAHLWHIVFYISAFIYFAGNLIFIIFGKAEIQWWNDPVEVKARKEMKKRNTLEMNVKN